mmetsp:Transcript_107864/g.315322  ORF Transcript_107864/g.315322 Transcript_107864/m.315322 type:complete len:123 (-) Transcript_107864:66-434(-)
MAACATDCAGSVCRDEAGAAAAGNRTCVGRKRAPPSELTVTCGTFAGNVWSRLTVAGLAAGAAGPGAGAGKTGPVIHLTREAQAAGCRVVEAVPPGRGEVSTRRRTPACRTEEHGAAEGCAG